MRLVKKVSDHLKPLSTDDVNFVRSIIEENEKCINVTVYNTLGRLYSYLAEEAVSEVYLLACRKVDVLRRHECPKAWLIVAARHVSQTLIRTHKNDLLNVEIEEAENIKSNDDVPEDAVYRIWLENKIPEKLIGSLTKREKEVYIKLYIEERTPKQAAEELGITANAVNNVHKNIRDKIKYAVSQKNF